MGGKFQTISPLNVHTRFTPKNSCILLDRVSTKVVERSVKFKILSLSKFVFILVFARLTL